MVCKSKRTLLYEPQKPRTILKEKSICLTSTSFIVNNSCLIWPQYNAMSLSSQPGCYSWHANIVNAIQSWIHNRTWGYTNQFIIYLNKILNIIIALSLPSPTFTMRICFISQIGTFKMTSRSGKVNTPL